MNLKKTLAVVAVMTVAASLTAPAALAKGRKDAGKGGKKAIAEVTTFDSATGALALTLKDGSTFAGTVTEDTKVKVEHRGNHKRGKGNSKPSNGDATDLVAGTKVLKFRTGDDNLTVKKIRVRPLATSTAPTTEAECDESDEADLEDDTDAVADEVDSVEDSLGSDDCDGEDADEADDSDDADDEDEPDDSDSDDSDGGNTDPAQCDPRVNPLGCVAPLTP